MSNKSSHSLYFQAVLRIFPFVVCIEIDQLFIVTFYNQLASPGVNANNKLFIVKPPETFLN